MKLRVVTWLGQAKAEVARKEEEWYLCCAKANSYPLWFASEFRHSLTRTQTVLWTHIEELDRLIKSFIDS